MNNATLDTAHRQWATRPRDQRFQTLQDLQASVDKRRSLSRQTTVNAEIVKVVDSSEGRLLINGEITACEPTHYSFGQLCGLIKAPADYIRTLPTSLVRQNLEYGLREGSTRGAHQFLTIDDENGDGPNTLQAITSVKYGRIWDADVVAAVARLVERTGGKFINPPAYKTDERGFAGITGEVERAGLYASDHDCFMFMVDGGSRLEAGPRAQLHRGFIVSNSETGAATFKLMTFLFNECCGNHIIWGATDINEISIRHTLNGPARFDSEALPTLKAYSEAPERPVIETIEKAQALMLPDYTSDNELEVIGSFAGKADRFTRGEVKNAIAFAKSEEGDCRTLWHLVQGFTAYARGFAHVDTRLNLETRAGSLLKLAA